ncbi:DUF5134 domain-containing protein [Streptomyces spiralis]|uniref:DUF5134 domain-containing protein n=1 Tax=Streptomyces spiralis TaxID=66376 RepID=A0A919E0V7_9ACTN|nr:DUF5134 domain-containing protein [Streptomyces spiralis]GHE98456.1 DUF5134 domain-containing protein [Streptomyces spiralis]
MDTPVDVVHSMLTVLFSLVAAHALWHGVRSPGRGRRDRVDHLLHFAMSVAMAAMPWSLGRSLPGRTTTVLFTLAALWFPLTALRRRTANRAAEIAGRLPPAAGMAAMAWMPRTHHGRAVPSHETLAGGVPAAHDTAAIGHATGAPVSAAGVTGLLTVYLLTCAIWSLTRPMPLLRSTAAAHRAAATDPYGHVRDGAMALGTALMLLMPH